MNTITASTGATLLALTFLPGCLAGLVQLARRDAQRAFPRWLAGLLGWRKYLGLWATWLLLVGGQAWSVDA